MTFAAAFASGLMHTDAAGVCNFKVIMQRGVYAHMHAQAPVNIVVMLMYIVYEPMHIKHTRAPPLLLPQILACERI